jgi:phosphate/sulfate permease
LVPSWNSVRQPRIRAQDKKANYIVAGAVGVGARVADTIRGKILTTRVFEAEPTMLMLGMTCALVGSSTYMTIATKIGLPVSTTHSIIGGVCTPNLTRTERC